jgi:hypothetical protein
MYEEGMIKVATKSKIYERRAGFSMDEIKQSRPRSIHRAAEEIWLKDEQISLEEFTKV